MKTFISRLLFFLIPFPIYIGVVVIIDPFNYFGVSDFIDYESKMLTSSKIHPQLWKLIEYKKVKSNRVILGDSRSVAIDINNIKQLTGNDIFNCSYGGGTLIDIIESFWYITKFQSLEEIYIGINFNLYNDFEENNRVEQAKSIMKNPLAYSFSKIILSAMIQNIKKKLFVKDFKYGTPNMTREEFWSFQLKVTGKRYYQKFKHPDYYYNELVKITKYCKQNNIKLIFFMPPTHVDLQQLISKFGLEKDFEIFVDEISGLSLLYNFDTENEYTRNKTNFRDPFHTLSDSLIVHTIWNKKRTDRRN